jgi:predicted membrane protein DUF2232
MIDMSLQQSEPVMLPGRPFGRTVRSIAGYALLTALMIRTGLTVFVPAMMIHSAIRNGRRTTWIMLAAATLAGFALFAITPSTLLEIKQQFSYLAMTVLALALPAMLALPMIERGEAFGRVLMMMLLGSALGLGLVELGVRAVASFSPYALILADVQAAVARVMKTNPTNGMPLSAVVLMQRGMNYYSTVLLPSELLLSNAVSFVLSLMMIGRLRAWFEFAAKRKVEVPGAYLFRNFALPDWFLFAFILGGIAPLVKGTLHMIAANVLMVAVFLYMLQGFALLRFLLASAGVGFIGALFAFGFTFITMIGPMLLGVAGLFDPFFDFRHYKKRKDDSHEGHSD